MAFIKINDVNFYYELHGKGHPLILIAGYSANHQAWLPVLEQLSQHFQVLIFDNHGIGQTTDDGKPLSVERMAKDIVALAEKLDLKKPHVLGHSMGGNIAQFLASHYPETVNKLVLLTTSVKWRQAMLKGLKSLLTLREKNIDFDITYAATLPWVFGEAFLQNTAVLETFKQAMISEPYPQSVANQQRQFEVLKAFDGTSYLGRIKAPTLVAYGIEDLLTLPGESQFIAEKILHVQLKEFNCAHMVQYEATQELAETLIKFFNN